MMNTNSAFTESSSASPQQQGLAAKGKKGKTSQTQTLFSRLLASLQQGSKGKTVAAAEKPSEAHTKEMPSQVVGKGNNKTVKTVKTAATLETKGKVVPAQVTTDKTKALVDSSVTNKSTPQIKSAEESKSTIGITKTESTLQTKVTEPEKDIIAVAQEAILIPQQVTKAEQKGENGNLLALTKDNKNKSVSQQPTNKKAQAEQQPSLKDLNTTTSPERSPVNNASNSVTHRPPAEFDAKVTQTLADTQNTKPIKTDADSTSRVITDSKDTAKASQTQLAQVKAESPDIASPKESTTQQQEKINTSDVEKTVSSLKTNSTDSNSKDAAKASQTPLAQAATAPQQKAPSQSQAQNHTVNAQAGTASINNRMSDSGSSTTSQQDLNSNQQQAEVSMLDTSKTDAKTSKGMDFQAQLAYKTQRTFTPADTMLEVVRSAKTGATSLELQLEPAHLGKVQVSIQMDTAKQIQVMFTVDQANSRHALEQQMPQLRLAMAQQGLDLGGFSMQMNQQGNQQTQGQAAEHAGAAINLDPTLSNNSETQSRIGVNMANHGHLSILA